MPTRRSRKHLSLLHWFWWIRDKSEDVDLDCWQWSSEHWGQSCELWTEFDLQRPAWRLYIFPPGRDLWTSTGDALRRFASWECISLPLLQFSWCVGWVWEILWMKEPKKKICYVSWSSTGRWCSWCTNESNIKHFTKAEISKKKKRSEFQFMWPPLSLMRPRFPRKFFLIYILTRFIHY